MFIANVVIPNFWVKLETLIKTEVPTFAFSNAYDYRFYTNNFEHFWIIDLLSGSTPSGDMGKVIRKDMGARFIYHKGAGEVWVKSYSGNTQMEIENNA